jgi:hypothetical protein
MSQPIANFKTVIVKGIIPNNESSFETDVNIEFIPDEVIIKRVTIVYAEADNRFGISFINTDMVYPNIIHAYTLKATINDETPVVSV